METLTLEASGFTFDALADGAADARTVLLLHGFPQTSREWSPLLAALAQAGYRAVAPDQRGYSPGARPKEVAAYAMAELVEDAVGLIDALGAEQVDLVGHDWGAAVAWQTAARFPDRVRSLSALSVPHPLALSRALANDPDQQQRSTYIGFFRQEAGIAERVLSAADWLGLKAIYGGKVADADIERYVEVFSADGALTAVLNWYRAISATAIKGLAAVTVPTLFVWGAEDVALGRVGAEATAEFVTGPYRFVELAGVGHWIPDEVPDRLSREILAHLAVT